MIVDKAHMLVVPPGDGVSALDGDLLLYDLQFVYSLAERGQIQLPI